MMQPEAIRERVRETSGAIAASKPSPACCDSTLLATCCPAAEKSACCGDVTEAAAPSTCGCQPSAIRA
jgi:hypothetical protein